MSKSYLGRKISRNTTRLPKALADELLASGAISSKNLSKQRGAKKGNANAPKRNDTNHKANAKTKVEQAKRTREPEEAEVEGQPIHKKRKQTALERMVEKQEPSSSKAKASTFFPSDPMEAQEAKEIAWLEAQLGIKGKDSKWKSELHEDGLDDLFDDIDRLETSLGGGASVADGETYTLESEEEEDDEDEEMDLAEFDTDEEALSDDAEADSDTEPESNAEADSEEEADEGLQDKAPVAKAEKKTVRFTSQEATSADAPTSYVPPHLRKKLETQEKEKEDQDHDPRLDRILFGHLNKLSPSNLSVILTAVDALFTQYPRAILTASLVRLVVDRVAQSSDILGDMNVLTFAGFAASFFGAGIGVREGILAESLKRWDNYSKHVDEQAGKEKSNMVRFWSRLYNLDVVGCQFIYGLIRELVKGQEDNVLGEYEVEQLLICLKTSGSKLRAEDPLSLKHIVQLVEDKKRSIPADSITSRTKFMIEVLTDLKNNKMKQTANQTGPGTVFATEEALKKHLHALGRKKAGGLPEPLRFTMDDLRASATKGRWWAVGAAWSGDPLAESGLSKLSSSSTTSNAEREEAHWTKLARKQGMNTEVRRAIFVALMGAEDYIDACDRLQALSLKEVQRREIIRVILHCCSNEKTYNPFYVLVMGRLLSLPSSVSHSYAITLQYSLWDFFREMGESQVGGQERIKDAAASESSETRVSSRRIKHLAKAYGWWLAKGGLTLSILKPLPFDHLLPQSKAFVKDLLKKTFLSIHCTSPLLKSPARFDAQAVEAMCVKVAGHDQLSRGLRHFIENNLVEDDSELVRESSQVAIETMRLGKSVAQEIEQFF